MQLQLQNTYLNGFWRKNKGDDMRKEEEIRRKLEFGFPKKIELGARDYDHLKPYLLGWKDALKWVLEEK